MEFVAVFLLSIVYFVVLLLVPVLMAAELACIMILSYGLFLRFFEPRQYRLFRFFENGGALRLLVAPVLLTLASGLYLASQTCCKTTFATFLFNVQLVVWGVGIAVLVSAIALRQLFRWLRF
ncbi:hypothetical protein ACJO5Y_07650 [Marinobacter sp. GN3S48]|uniref:hypothetical protein n=1 Tax=Marinobacter sp. GN3S48 TaxID=3382302 RepID=UPI00387B883F